MTHIRDEINRVTQSRRMLAHGLVTPQLGQADLDFMDHAGGHAARSTPGRPTPVPPPRDSSTAGSSTTRRSPIPCSRKRARLGVRRFCVHKGLPLGPVADYNHPRDLIKAAKDFPDIDFLVYHAGLLSVSARQANG